MIDILKGIRWNMLGTHDRKTNDKNDRDKQKMTKHRNEYMYMNDRYIYEYMNE